ncbi:transcriptional regulator of acetoin/glycerol metabolism [Amycolatopsis bartoniae]|uniref:GAF domain-containing protein n=1 Tax=Amycolatopsis bartoniae TaxID=941986 RepID=A0A8H9IMU6_9PSEU|nr:hypothetical protein [Amycolatopsis bartoniae]MBB2940271.1 transcriptional regulator of acetoin/glycerol metabolism [Amycolatopsis bartoniae]TVT10153.1 hypothetical protein FNH07_06135 [Amycolatopsis bartoniae]GHF35296.1 hypothetical protein GCM10017566_05070 [Amycolatopsis bartoniae]
MSTLDNAVDQLRLEITLSWHRAHLSGLSPATCDLPVEQSSVDRRSALLIVAEPVLAALAHQLGDDAAYCVVLADRHSRACGTASASFRVGSSAKKRRAPNSIATAHELRHGITVRGEEHYVEAFKPFSCYGQPIFHPATRRLEGVLDITCLSGDESPLLKPFLSRAVQEIGERLLAFSRHSQQRLLGAFQVASGRRDGRLAVGTGHGHRGGRVVEAGSADGGIARARHDRGEAGHPFGAVDGEFARYLHPSRRPQDG